MNPLPSSLWQTELPRNLDQRLKELFDAAKQRSRPIRIFFRADDIGRIDNNFIQMMQLFADYDMPLCLALVPQWLSADNWRQIRSPAIKKDLFCWHQHGFNHINHESVGKKCEFGESRSIEKIRHDILAGKMSECQARPHFTDPILHWHGMKYEFGAGVSRNRKKAYHWYEQAALQGWAQAAFMLGSLYLKSSPANQVRGCTWLGIAEEQGYPAAVQARQQACSNLNRKTARKAKKLGKRLRDRIYKTETLSATE